MAWTSDDLSALESAIKQGAKKVKYADKEIEYRDLSEMFQLRSMMRRELGLETSMGRVVVSTSKGLS